MSIFHTPQGHQSDKTIDVLLSELVSPPAQKPGLELGGSLPGLVGTPKPGSLVTLKDGRTLKVQRISKRGVLTLCHTCGGFAAYSHVSAVVAV